MLHAWWDSGTSDFQRLRVLDGFTEDIPHDIAIKRCIAEQLCYSGLMGLSLRAPGIDSWGAVIWLIIALLQV